MYDKYDVESIEKEAEKLSEEKRNIKFYVIWNKYGEWGYVDYNPVDTEMSGEHWVCYYLNGGRYD